MEAANSARKDDSTSYYEARQKIYPREVKGTFARLRTTVMIILLGIYYVLPWIRWEGRQSVLFDLPARKFYIFGLTFWPHDFFFLAWLLIIAAITLFLFTAVAGRVWCGYACPQTVWTEIFIQMERWTEGNRQQRMRLDKAPWGAEKILRKSGKQILWLGFAAFTGFTFVGYFTPVTQLAAKIAGFELGPWEIFWIAFYSLATYANAGLMREQVCKYMCPYARFQSAMFDRDTLIIQYDTERGENRGRRKRGDDYRARGLGDCIDCTMCVQVCPTGIDIRDGLQYDCIACAACVDVCDTVMERVGYPKGLVRYSTQHAMDHEATRILRPRTIIYAVIWLGLIVSFFYAIGARTPLAMDVIRDRKSLYRNIGPNEIENVYTLKILNKDDQPHQYRLRVDGLPGLQIDVDPRELDVKPGDLATVPLRLRAKGSDVPAGGSDILLILEAADDSKLKVTTDSRFIAPPPGR